MRSLQKMVREHLNPQTTAGTAEANTGITLYSLRVLMIRSVFKVLKSLNPKMIL